MVRTAVGPGEDVEAWCTRCRMNLNHRVIAVVGQGIQRVHCLTCGGDHKYYPPKRAGSTEPDSKRAKSVSTASSAASARDRKSADRAAGKAYGEWATFMKDMPEGTVPRPYRTAESYKAAEYIEHPEFGTGRVVDVLGAERIEVAFKIGRKVMVCNRSKTA
jgi:hypothetical protein